MRPTVKVGNKNQNTKEIAPRSLVGLTVDMTGNGCKISPGLNLTQFVSGYFKDTRSHKLRQIYHKQMFLSCEKDWSWEMPATHCQAKTTIVASRRNCLQGIGHQLAPHQSLSSSGGGVLFPHSLSCNHSHTRMVAAITIHLITLELW